MSTCLPTHSPFKNQSKYKHCTFVLPGQCFHLKRLVLPDSTFPDDVVTDDLSRASSGETIVCGHCMSNTDVKEYLQINFNILEREPSGIRCQP